MGLEFNNIFITPKYDCRDSYKSFIIPLNSSFGLFPSDNMLKSYIKDYVEESGYFKIAILTDSHEIIKVPCIIEFSLNGTIQFNKKSYLCVNALKKGTMYYPIVLSTENIKGATKVSDLQMEAAHKDFKDNLYLLEDFNSKKFLFKPINEL